MFLVKMILLSSVKLVASSYDDHSMFSLTDIVTVAKVIQQKVHSLLWSVEQEIFNKLPLWLVLFTNNLYLYFVNTVRWVTERPSNL